MKVELSEEADGQVKQIDVWWRANRLAAPDLFTNELEAALTTLGEIPTLGVKYDTERGLFGAFCSDAATTTCTSP